MAKKSVREKQAPDDGTLKVRRDGAGKIWSHVRSKWLVETPEERVRQEYLPELVNEYGFALGQIDEELEVTGRGAGQARADFVIWRTAEERRDGRNPLIIVECKSDNVTISAADYYQGDNYARMYGAKFLVTHNTRETKYWRVIHDRAPKTIEEIENIPDAKATDREIEELIAKLKVFKEDEFADLLHQCHNVIRNREKKDPAAAFDEIAKILFVKVWVERELKSKRKSNNLFTADFLDAQLGDSPLNDLFLKTKDAFKSDKIFADDEKINLKPATAREIVKKLEKYNLSDTSEDVKGIAFERFLGRTFRGEIGQFFTPRTIVEFMIRMVEPSEADVICDPSSGSGGFLIRFFEIVRERVLRDIDARYRAYKDDLASKKLSEAKRAEMLRAKFDELQREVDQTLKDSRLWTLANRRIYGTDANDRMARTSKMNMIMHGDGHGGVHHHDGFINVNGIFEERFDIVLTNPPFGASVEPTDVIQQIDVDVSDEDYDRYVKAYGEAYKEAQARVQAAVGKSITTLFELPKTSESKMKTEILFIDRCLSLLKPGGRLGIVLPEGVFNNPSLQYVRDFCEDRARILAVVSLPPETFLSSGASVKASLLFLQKMTADESVRYATEQEAAQAAAEREVEANVEARRNALQSELAALGTKNTARRKELGVELRVLTREAKKLTDIRARELLKAKVDYDIFMYDAKSVGITATGEADANELYPNESVPTDIAETALELYRRFRSDPKGFTSVQE
jgi:type I restriction enzyme M protein